MKKPFWKTTALIDMSKDQWESLCDGCALCCLQKLQDDESDDVYYTDVHCQYMDRDNCQCTVYENRNQKVPTCVWLTPEQATEFKWLPTTCAYRLIAEGKDLPEWHPLVSGDKETVHTAGISMHRRGIPDNMISEDQWQDRIIWKA